MSQSENEIGKILANVEVAELGESAVNDFVYGVGGMQSRGWCRVTSGGGSGTTFRRGVRLRCLRWVGKPLQWWSRRASTT